jgi:hypothetical protein
MSEAYNGVSQVNLIPKFDEQQAVYDQIQKLLDDAIVAFNNPNNKTSLNFSGGDIMYQGDVDKWRRFAWSLKARYLNHLSKKTSLYNPAAIIEACQNGFNADGMDAEFAYLANGQQTDENPWYSWGGFDNPADLRYFTWTQFFVDLLTKLPVTETPFQDPRISRIMTPAKSDGQYRGLRPGLGLAGGQGGSGQFTADEDYPGLPMEDTILEQLLHFPFITTQKLTSLKQKPGFVPGMHRRFNCL